ncbi:Fasciclin domain-containing protein [Mucilaginibacter sp. OK098]|nr:Fasciclin domain-containing protein [Mucilaginibacter sp. OK098]
MVGTSWSIINLNKEKMKNISKLIIVFALANIVFVACKKDNYIIGGKLENATTTLSTYDYLKNNRYKMFDTLLLVIDKAGLKDVINAKGITFYAPTDFSINNYLQAKTIAAQKNNPFARYSIDTLIKYDLNTFKDSLNTYIIPQKIIASSLTESGVVFNTAKNGSQAVISYEQTFDTNLGYTSAVSTAPRIEYYTFIKGHLPPVVVASQIPDTVGVRVLCQTSGLTTSTGQLNVLSNSHVLFFKH